MKCTNFFHGDGKCFGGAFLLKGLLAVIILLAVFQAGIFVGYRKAAFSGKIGDNFSRNFGERSRGIFGGPGGMMEGKFDPSTAHGTAGRIVSIRLPEAVISDPADGIEKTVLFGAKTEIRKYRETIVPADLAIDDMIVVIGEPNADGKIEAKLVRVVPPPPERTFATSTKP